MKLSYRGDGGEFALLDVKNIKENVLFLPRLSSNGYSTTVATLGRYAVITDEWGLSSQAMETLNCQSGSLGH